MDTMNTTGIPAPQAIPETTTANPAKRLADAIETVLNAAKARGITAMGATEISKDIVAQGLWPEGKSKDLSKATWNALRGDINKGEVSRFVKVDGKVDGKKGKGKYAIKG